MIFRPIWFLRFFFPILFIGLVAYNLLGLSQGSAPLQQMTLFDWFMFGLEIIILYFMVLFLTIRYEISNGVLKIRSFVIKRKSYPISDIILIEENGMFSKFHKPNIGLDGTTLHIKGGKKINIVGLSDHYKFIQLIRSKLSS